MEAEHKENSGSDRRFLTWDRDELEREKHLPCPPPPPNAGTLQIFFHEFVKMSLRLCFNFYRLIWVVILASLSVVVRLSGSDAPGRGSRFTLVKNASGFSQRPIWPSARIPGSPISYRLTSG
ncbi:hypothetical protein BD410DRAFT_846273 [Rickenella mellea]|uniref:Uncharacterized protein n=1 Tax=Rickenella mellea TaxID=50990 RepID=A0A4Y7PFS9_9AGAM|nr:hypothetical protein BD410DRAFT_846273 [Rickenella mellea]